jgi:hypothetical protein
LLVLFVVGIFAFKSKIETEKRAGNLLNTLVLHTKYGAWTLTHTHKHTHQQVSIDQPEVKEREKTTAQKSIVFCELCSKYLV